MPLEKTNASGYLKDTKTGTILNTNEVEYEQILAAREKQRKEQALAEEVETLKNDMNDIKSMLAQLLNRT